LQEYRRAWAEVHLENLIHNVRAIRKAIPAHTKLLAAVKADAYGHGAVETSKALLENGADSLGVALCEEGLKLRANQVRAPILVMSYTPEPLLDAVVANGLIQTVFSVESALALARAAAKRGTPAEVHIKIDTGMGRLGFLPGSDAADKIGEILREKALRVTGIYTHFAKSDSLDAYFMYEQYERFLYMLHTLKERGAPVNHWTLHAGNSGMLSQVVFDRFYQNCQIFTNNQKNMENQKNNTDQFPQKSKAEEIFLDMARIGIMLYGLPPSSEMSEVCNILQLRPVMRLMTRISMTKTLPPRAGVSYGHLFHTNRETIVATLPIGYADGYPRLLSNKGHVVVRGHYAPIIGAICMDQCMIDVTDIPSAHEIKPGEEVTLFGSGACSADELANQIGTIGYELVCGVGKRVPRVYI